MCTYLYGEVEMSFKDLLKDTRYTFTVNEKAPEWIYRVLEEKGMEILFCKKDRAKWKVVMDYDWFVDNLLKGGDDDMVACPTCGSMVKRSVLRLE